jgi:hypothetical protein
MTAAAARDHVARQEIKLPFGNTAGGRMVSVEAVERRLAHRGRQFPSAAVPRPGNKITFTPRRPDAGKPRRRAMNRMTTEEFLANRKAAGRLIDVESCKIMKTTSATHIAQSASPQIS